MAVAQAVAWAVPMQGAMSSELLRVVFAPPGPGHALAQRARDLQVAHAAVALRVVVAADLIGRDVRECDRLVVAGEATFAAAPWLRELFAQARERTVAVVDGPIAAPALADELAALRRNCGRVVTDTAATKALLRERLLLPVHAVALGDGAALHTVLRAAPGRPDLVVDRLCEAQQYVLRGDPLGAFGAAARALQLAPDQPGVVADVARLLANLGELSRAVALCRSFLQQRPDAAPVAAALAQIGGVLAPQAV